MVGAVKMNARPEQYVIFYGNSSAAWVRVRKKHCTRAYDHAGANLDLRARYGIRARPEFGQVAKTEELVKAQSARGFRKMQAPMRPWNVRT